MTPITPQIGLLILFGFGLIMLLSSLLLRKTSLDQKQFLLANRKLGWLPGSFSIAASWIWAPALFISVQAAYENGLAGLFWFTVPNILALMSFSLFAPKIRMALPDGTTLPEFIALRFGSDRLKKLYLFPTLFYQIMAMTVQLFAGGSFIHLLTGLPLNLIMPIMLGIALSYSLLAGLKASVLTDVLQLSLIFGIGVLILPIIWSNGGGVESIIYGFEGGNNVSSIFDPGVAFSFGIVTSIGLFAGALSDQQYWQRSFAIKQKELVPAFIMGGLLFGLVPLGLSTLGFIAVSQGFILPQGTDNSMIGVFTAQELLPSWAMLLFFIMLLCGLSSTLDSSLSAVSSLWATDIQAKKGIRGARLSMLGIGLLSWLIAILANSITGFGLQHLWWVFNTIAACTAGPTLLSIYSKRVNEKGVFWGITLSFLIGIPLFIYSNIIGNSLWIVSSAIFVVLMSSGLSFLPNK